MFSPLFIVEILSDRDYSANDFVVLSNETSIQSPLDDTLLSSQKWWMELCKHENIWNVNDVQCFQMMTQMHILGHITTTQLIVCGKKSTGVREKRTRRKFKMNFRAENSFVPTNSLLSSRCWIQTCNNVPNNDRIQLSRQFECKII